MEDEGQPTNETNDTMVDHVAPEPSPTRRSRGWHALWFLLHLAAVYVIANYCTALIAGWVGGTLLPALGHPPTTGGFQFLFSHLLAFSLLPAFVAGFVNARFRHAAAQFVWTVPLVVLAYKILTFPHPVSVLYETTGISAGLHHYFDATFEIPEYHSYQEMFQLYAGNPDVFRGFDQLHFTAPFYAAIGYSLATLLSIRWKRSLPEILDGIERWHKGSRLADAEGDQP